MMESITRMCAALVAAGALSGIASAQAQVLKNGDFSNGKSHWEGGGQVVTLNDAGEPAKPEEGGKPVLEVKLSKQSFTQIRQRVHSTDDLPSLNMAVKIRTSADYHRNDKSFQYTKDVNWESGGWRSWSKLVYPRVDFCMRMDAKTHHYLPRSLKSGGDWQTVKGKFVEMAPKGSKIFTLMFAPGEGTVWVKSVEANP